MKASYKNIVKGVIIAGVQPSSETETSALTLTPEDSRPDALVSFTGNTELTSFFLAEHHYTTSDAASGKKTTKTYQYVLGALAMADGGIGCQEGSRVDIRTEFDAQDGKIRERAAWAYGNTLDLAGTELHGSTHNGVRFGSRDGPKSSPQLRTNSSFEPVPNLKFSAAV